MYTRYVEISITEFRRDLFAFVARAQAGESVIVLHKGNRFRLIPETPPNRLSQLTPMQVIDPEVSEAAEQQLQEEMRQAWEQDWDSL
jgi:antitoxin (DNA-binding transcriptional repressor) of toxin-antitoxin stability system